MNVIAKSALVNFWSSLPKGAPRETAEAAMMEWYTTASKASWSNFCELKKTFNSADIVAGNKVIFDVGRISIKADFRSVCRDARPVRCDRRQRPLT